MKYCKIMLAAAFVAAALMAAEGDRVEMEWYFPLKSSHEGLPFGNAESGFLVWGGGRSLKVTLGRDDTWDHRGGYDWNEDQSYANITAALKSNDMDMVKNLFRRGEIKPGEPKNPQIIPVGHFEFDLPEGLHLTEGELETGTGLASICIARDRDDKEVGTIEIALDRKSGVLAIKWPKSISAVGRAIPAWEHENVRKELEPILFKPPVKFGLRGGAGFAQALPADPALAAGFVNEGNVTFLVSSRGTDTAAAEASVAEKLAVAAAKGYGATRKASEKFWADWWRDTPEIDIPDRVIREIHDFGMYKFGSMTGADGVPAPLQGPWIEEYRLPPWHGDYHFNINVQMCYWPAFRGNHLESLKPLFRMVKSWWPILRENARKFAGIKDGFMLPHSVDDRCRLIGGYWAGTMDHACTAWTCQMMFRYVTMSGDIEFLRTDAYPLMKGAMNVYRAMMEEDKGRLSFPASTSPEFDSRGGWGRDASFQLAACHRLVRDLIKAAQMLGEEPDPMWLDIKNRLPLASFAGGPGGEIELWRGLTLPESHRHHSHLAGYVPFDVWDYGDELIRRSTAKTVRTWQREGMGLWSGWAMPWAAMLQTHWGNADAADMTLRIWERMFTNPGHGSRHDVYHPGFSVMRRGANASAFGVSGDAEGEEIMQIDGAMAATAAVHEMFLHERGGVARVFQGAPERWRDASFRNLLSDNGTLVSAKRRNGKVECVELVSKRGGLIRIESPWKKGVILKIQLKAGETRRLTCDEDDPPPSRAQL